MSSQGYGDTTIWIFPEYYCFTFHIQSTNCLKFVYFMYQKLRFVFSKWIYNWPHLFKISSFLCCSRIPPLSQIMCSYTCRSISELYSTCFFFLMGRRNGYFALIHCFLNYCNFKIILDIHYKSSSLLPLQNCVGYSWPFAIPYKFYGQLVNIHQNSCQDIEWDYIEFIGQFAEKWYLY